LCCSSATTKSKDIEQEDKFKEDFHLIVCLHLRFLIERAIYLHEALTQEESLCCVQRDYFFANTLPMTCTAQGENIALGNTSTACVCFLLVCVLAHEFVSEES
jgi:hypothetical protein